MAQHVFDVGAFRGQFAQFADANKYPDATLSGYFSMAATMLPDYDTCYFAGDQLQLALDLLTAHIAALYTKMATGAQTGVATGGTQGSTSVSLLAPPVKSMFDFWLAQTPYGQQLLMLLNILRQGIQSVGGSLSRAGFRQADGRFFL